MTIRQLVGDCRVQLATLETGSAQCCITSPPYYGLRSYGTPDLVWGGELGHKHEWDTPSHSGQRLRNGLNGTLEGGKPAESMGQILHPATGTFCECGAWLASLGLEPTPELYVEHIVECFRHVRRVLRDDGTLWLNLGDSYNNRSVSRPSSHQGGLGFHNASIDTSWAEHASNGHTRLSLTSGGLKEKDLMMMPFRVAMALQQDGWYLRSVIPWLKRNSMPESVTDRPSTAVEYVFLLAKSARYYWDADAVRSAASENTYSRGNGLGPKQNGTEFGQGIKNNNDFGAAIHGHVSHRNRRNSDWWFESWQGMLLDEQDDPLAFVVNPQSFTGSHFATFPPKLVEPMVKASTSQRGCCPECGVPWVRTVNYKPSDACQTAWDGKSAQISKGLSRNGSFVGGLSETTGWRPSCAHMAAEPVPCTVLDPFGGAGTVGLVADRLGRNAVLCELKSDYVDMGVNRVEQDAPLFHGAPVILKPRSVIGKQAQTGNRTYDGFNARWNAREAKDSADL